MPAISVGWTSDKRGSCAVQHAYLSQVRWCVAWIAHDEGRVKVGCNTGWPRDSLFSLPVPHGDGESPGQDEGPPQVASPVGAGALAQSGSAVGNAADSAALAFDQSTDATAVAAGSEMSTAAAVAKGEPGAAGDGASASASAGQAIRGGSEPAEAEPRRIARSSVEPTRLSTRPTRRGLSTLRH
jgi:hypothetical protein